MKEVKKEYKGIDIMKFLLAIVIIIYHTRLYTGNNHTLKTIYDLLLSSAVPLFFITSGFFVYDKYKQEERITKLLKKNIKLYLIWNLIYLPIAIYGDVINNYSVGKSILLYIREFLFLGEHYFSCQIWYLLSFIYSLIILLVLKKLKLNDIKIFIITILIYVFATVMVYLTSNNFDYKFVKLFSSIFSTGKVFLGPAIVTLGMFINKYKDKIKISKIVLLLMIVLCTVVSIIFPNKISRIMLYIFVFLLVMNLNNIKFNTVNFRKCSIIFYFIHMINLFIYMLIVGINNTYGIYSFIFTLITCIIESVIIIAIQNKWNPKVLKEIFS